MARPAMPSEPSRSHPPSHSAIVALPAGIGRADVPAIVAECLDPGRGRGPLTCDASALVDPRLPAVDAIAQVVLEVRRRGRPFRLVGAGPELLDLVDLCGLDGALGTEPR